MRRVCLVSYDISDPRRWRQVYRTMRGFGEHLQLSVFSCDLTPAQRVTMIAALEEAIDRDDDQVLLIDLGPSQAQPIQQIEALGRPLSVRDRSPVVL
ncbi:MAG: CRISPR-associated endonuclease Cas2 [Candidatus Rokubacteria bacterium]|nr:CRISPR-associated endonuclease Cas2 [Candidatus Rokubacteria bacterium]